MSVFKSDLHVLAVVAGVLLLSLLWQIWLATSLQSRFDEMHDDAQAQTRTLMTEIGALKDTVLALQKQVVALQEKAGAPSPFGSGPAAATNALSARVAALDAKTAAVQEALEAVASELKRETGEVKTGLGRVQTDVAEVKSGIGEARTAQGEMLAAVSGLTAETNAIKAAQSEMQTAVSGLKTEIDAAKVGQNSLQAAVGDLTKAIQERSATAALPAASARGETFRIFFENRGSFAGGWLREAVATKVAEISAFMGGRKDCTVAAEGHTDTVGPDAVNTVISHLRATAVTDLLRGMISDAEIAAPKWAGERRLLVPTPDRISEPKNRRVDITVRCGGAQARG